MSGFLLTTREDGAIDEAVSAQRAWPWEVASDLSAMPGLRGGLTRLGPASQWAPAHDPACRLTVAIVGRFVPPSADWAADASGALQGGSIPARLLALWRDDPEAALLAMNGACTWIVLDSREHTLEIVTDRLGIQPVYARHSPQLVLASDPDVLAAHEASCGYSLQQDAVSQAEMLATGCVSHPFTYHRGVEQLAAASHYRWKLDQPGRPPWSRAYWRPAREEDGRQLDDQEAVEAMTAALRGAMRRRQQADRPAPTLLLSGGLDSRAMLFAAPRPGAFSCVTFCDAPNSETQTAVEIAAAVGAPHSIWRRDPEHYAAGAADTVRWSGGMGSIAEGHFAAFGERWAELSLRPLLSGCYADYLLKGLAINRGYKSLLGRNLPERTFGAFADAFYKPHVRLGSKYGAAVRERLRARFGSPSGAEYHRLALTVADRRIRPLSREADCAGRLWLLRHLDWDPVFADSALVELYGRLSVEQMLNGAILGQAARRLTPRTALHIRDNNTRGTIGASLRRTNAEFVVGKAARMARSLLWPAERTKNSGSWPDMRLLVQQSRGLAGQWRSISPEAREQVGLLAGEDPWDRTPAEWGSQDPDYFLRMLTLGLWLDRESAEGALATGALSEAALVSARFDSGGRDR